METRNYQDNAQLDLRIIHFSCAFFLFTQNFVLVRIIAQMPDRDHGLLITVLPLRFSSLPQGGPRAPSTADPLQRIRVGRFPCG
jgi:hypothetical protein